MLPCHRSRSENARHIVLLVVTFLSLVHGAAGPAAAEPAEQPIRKNVILPGLVVNFADRCVDIEAVVCLDRGMLELIACMKGSKEHESIVAVEARPMHIHTALLLLGANNGNPAMRRPVGDAGTRWVDIPPRGDLIDVFLVFKDKDSRLVEHAISDFVARSDQRSDGIVVDENASNEGGADEEDVFPKTFVFAGSHLRDNGPGPRTYLAEESGDVISIATFGDEVLCLPGMHAQANDALMWQVDARELPKVRSKVTLRLRPQKKNVMKAGEADNQQTSEDAQQDKK